MTQQETVGQCDSCLVIQCRLYITLNHTSYKTCLIVNLYISPVVQSISKVYIIYCQQQPANS